MILEEEKVDDISQLDETDQSALCECEAGCTELRYVRLRAQSNNFRETNE